VSAEPTNADPSGTATVRRRYGERLRGRWRALKAAIRDGIQSRDVFGLNDAKPRPLAAEYEAPDDLPDSLEGRDEAKVRAFMAWFDEQLSKGVLKVIGPNRNPYLRTAYEQGVRTTDRALESESEGEGVASPNESLQVGSGVGASTALAELTTRQYEKLKDVVAEVKVEVRATVELVINPDPPSPTDLAAKVNDRIDSVGIYRSNLMAETGPVEAAADGVLDASERLGIQTVQVRGEWITAGDSRVCPVCASIEGVYTIKQIRRESFSYEASAEEPDSLTGQYRLHPPAHPRCRCRVQPFAFAPGEEPVNAVKPSSGGRVG